MWATEFDTPLGRMIAIADEQALHRLEFIECCDSEYRSMERGMTAPLLSITQEIKAYFDGRLRTFKTPLFLCGSAFQKQVWTALQKIPCGETRSYANIARAIGKPSAHRAVANANGRNPLAI